MKPATKMMLMTSRKDENGERLDDRRYNQEPDSRFRDRRGRERYDDGRFAPRNEYDPPRSNGDEPEMNRYPMTPHIPPLYEYQRRGEWEDRRPRNAMPVSGFGSEPRSHYGQEKGHEMEMARGQDQSWELEPLDEESAKKCLAQLKNEDGTTGPHWTLEQVKQVMAQKMLPGNPVEMWVAMNLMWSDYFNVGKKFNVNNTEFYIEMAKAFLHDKDGGDMKLEKYLEYVVK